MKIRELPEADGFLNDDEIQFLQHSDYIEGERFDGEGGDDHVAAWKFMRAQPHMTVTIVQRTHYLLMRTRQTIPDAAKGRFTRVRTAIYGGGGRLIKVNPAPVLIPGLMRDFVRDLNCAYDAGTDEDRAKLAYQYHVRFENIHPFQDGNGRVGRMLLNWHRKRLGLPVLVIREEERAEYYRSLR